MAFQKYRRQFSRLGGFLLINTAALFHHFRERFQRVFSIRSWEALEKELKQFRNYDYDSRIRQFAKAHISFESKKNLRVEKLHREFLEYKSRQSIAKELKMLEKFGELENIGRRKS